MNIEAVMIKRERVEDVERSIRRGTSIELKDRTDKKVKKDFR